MMQEVFVKIYNSAAYIPEAGQADGMDTYDSEKYVLQQNP